VARLAPRSAHALASSPNSSSRQPSTQRTSFTAPSRAGARRTDPRLHDRRVAPARLRRRRAATGSHRRSFSTPRRPFTGWRALSSTSTRIRPRLPQRSRTPSVGCSPCACSRTRRAIAAVRATNSGHCGFRLRAGSRGLRDADGANARPHRTQLGVPHFRRRQCSALDTPALAGVHDNDEHGGEQCRERGGNEVTQNANPWFGGCRELHRRRAPLSGASDCASGVCLPFCVACGTVLATRRRAHEPCWRGG
jgi:hypothetical protein